MKSDSDLATLFASFAHPSRIAILRALLPSGPSGQTFGGLADRLKISPSTLTHHLREMEAGGVLCRETCGRATRLSLNLKALEGAVSHLSALCCCDDQITLRPKQDQTP